MIGIFCDAAGSLCTALITMYYLDLKYSHKIKKTSFCAAVTGFSSVLFLAAISGIFAAEIFLFFISAFLISVILFGANFISAVFMNLMLSVVSSLSRITAMFLLSGIFGVGADMYSVSSLTAAAGKVIGISVYLAAVYIITRFTDRKKQNNIWVSLSLLIMPMASVFIMITAMRIYSVFSLSDRLFFEFVFGGILLLLADIATIYVHEFAVKSLDRAEKTEIENLRLKNRERYYSMLHEQNEDSKILMHDIKKHLAVIGRLGNDDRKISEYISDISDNFGITNPIDYSSNDTLNLITHLFFVKCRENNIRFDVNIREAKLDFMSTPDITALFDNLLENAFEAAVLSEEKQIDFSVYIRNRNFQIIRLVNSCSLKPEIVGGEFVTNKKTRLHGIGTKSIKRVVRKYDGEADMKFNEENCTFECVVMLHMLEK